MSDATEQPAPQVDADAWEKACAEDLAAEQARRRAEHGAPPGSAAEELRRLVDAVTEKLSSVQAPFLGAVAQGTAEQVAKQVVRQARSVVEPVIERNSDVLDHLAAAGSELLAAYRSAVEGQERRWTQRSTDPTATGDAKDADGSANPKDEGPGGEHIDLD
ncbi:DUF5304 domain-containing protein [Streptomyces longispororuber]|uniref:DUF5304 domain-containing protein n=1 Tax=Streptomyces longispororuber TaxID=68230 RepID=UPI00210B58F2|nr:DUF5304 domain-containing protein [Streptomyces longispororuber]MCQ4208499.1 DUF5304 domain-containing protein [Streptomyces longispororuber]